MQQHGLAESVLCIWFAVWAFRKRYEVDETLDRTAQAVRWILVAALWALVGALPGPRWAVTRVILGFAGLAFLCWPNLAFHVVRLFRAARQHDDIGKQ
jgi:hypothetical protein